MVQGTPPPTHADTLRGMIAEYEQAEQRVMRMAAMQSDFRSIMLETNRQRREALHAALAGMRIAGLSSLTR